MNASDYAQGSPNIDPANQVLRRIQEGNQAFAFGSYSTSPIKVFTVCVDQMSGKYMAFLGSDPAKKATGENSSSAVITLLLSQNLIAMKELD